MRTKKTIKTIKDFTEKELKRVKEDSRKSGNPLKTSVSDLKGLYTIDTFKAPSGTPIVLREALKYIGKERASGKEVAKTLNDINFSKGIEKVVEKEVNEYLISKGRLPKEYNNYEKIRGLFTNKINKGLILSFKIVKSKEELLKLFPDGKK